MEQKPVKRSSDQLSLSAKKQKLEENPTAPSAPLPDDEAGDNLKLLNGYTLWLNQFYNGRDMAPEMISKKLSRPLHEVINRINFMEMTNVWCDSKILFDRIKRKYWLSGITIHKAIADFPPKIGDIAKKSSSFLRIGATNQTASSSESSPESESESDSSESDSAGIPRHILKVNHAKICRVEKIIGYSTEEWERYSRILGIKHSHARANEGESVRGWIINPLWRNVCSVFGFGSNRQM